MTKKCDQCDRPYQPYRPWHRFCSEECRKDWHLRRWQEIRDWYSEAQEGEHGLVQ
jgi:hypothetical protein